MSYFPVLPWKYSWSGLFRSSWAQLLLRPWKIDFFESHASQPKSVFFWLACQLREMYQIKVIDLGSSWTTKNVSMWRRGGLNQSECSWVTRPDSLDLFIYIPQWLKNNCHIIVPRIGRVTCTNPAESPHRIEWRAKAQPILWFRPPHVSLSTQWE